jgi:flagellar biogenesis protein FliO
VDLVQQMAVAGLVLALLAAVLWFLRRKGWSIAPARPAGGRRLVSLERLRLGPQHTLHLVRLGRSALLLAATPSGCTLVQAVPSAELENTPEAAR